MPHACNLAVTLYAYSAAADTVIGP